MLSRGVMRRAAKHLPGPVKSMARSALHRGRHWAHPGLKKFGTVQDLCYWVVEDGKDTMLLLQNYFSALYPMLDTRTEGLVRIYNDRGEPLGSSHFDLPKDGCAKVKVSSILEDLNASDAGAFGTLEVHIDIPKNVLEHIRPDKNFYFWDRFYIGYTSAQGQPCFVHGVDKTSIYRHGNPDPVEWYPSPGGHEWAPEIPVNMVEYKKFSVIFINRTARNADLKLNLWDVDDRSLTWAAAIPPKGVHRFDLTLEDIAGLVPDELRMRVEGMATQYGRPVVFKEFPNGAISAMHC